VFGVLLQLSKWGILSVENNKTNFDEKNYNNNSEILLKLNKLKLIKLIFNNRKNLNPGIILYNTIVTKCNC